MQEFHKGYCVGCGEYHLLKNDLCKDCYKEYYGVKMIGISHIILFIIGIFTGILIYQWYKDLK